MAPATHSPALARLAAVTDALLADVAALPAPNRPAPDGGWSGVQVVRHLLGAETGITALLEKAAARPAADLPAAGLKNWFRARLMRYVLNQPERRFQAPARLAPPTAEPTADLTALRAEWAALRTRLAAAVAAMPATHRGRTVFQHPRAGWLTLNQTLGFLADHVAHHRFQVARLRA